MLPCFRTWTLPRSVAFSIGSRRGSKKRMPSGALAEAEAVGAAVRALDVTRSCVSRAIVVSAEGCQSLCLVGHHERVDELVEVAVHDPRQRRQVELDPMVGEAVLREVVRPDLLGPVARADHRPPL